MRAEHPLRVLNPTRVGLIRHPFTEIAPTGDGTGYESFENREALTAGQEEKYRADGV